MIIGYIQKSPLRIYKIRRYKRNEKICKKKYQKSVKNTIH